MTGTSNNGRPTMASLGYTEQFTSGSEQGPEPPVAKRHWGKYRGTVVDNQDIPPSGRLLVSVPGIVITNWAMPCVPLADILAGTFVRPRIGANVWVEFERGDPDKPIWVGCWWGEGQIPRMAEEYNAVPEVSVMTIESATAGISICDVPIEAGVGTPGSVNIIAGAGAVTIALTPGSVSITAPEVTITAEAAINLSAPEVTIETGEFNVTAAEAVTTETGDFNVTAPEVTIETGDFNVTAAAVTAETGEFNLAALAAVTIETELFTSTTPLIFPPV